MLLLATGQFWAASMYILLIHVSLMQAYNLLQLLYFSLEKVTEEGEGGTNLTSDQTYPSVIHPPELDPALMTVYRYYIYIYIPLSISTYKYNPTEMSPSPLMAL